MEYLQNTRLFMLDLDGTFYLGNQLLPGAEEFIALCRSRGIGFTFLTNNSSKNPQDYIRKLAGLGVDISPQEILTSGDATLLYMQENQLPKRILLVGTPSLEAQFCSEGYTLTAQNPEAVVLGFDTTLSYEKLTDLCNAVRAGLPYIATHPDFNCPVPGGFIPDIGATIAYVEAATGRRPDVVVGKPNAAIARAAAQRGGGLQMEQLTMVGDRLYTDIALGACGVNTVLVLSGETRADEVAQAPVQPDIVCRDLAHLAKLLRSGG